MPKLENIERASERNWLWPTISDALDTFIRRRDQDAKGYERIWRLIHVWESVNVTLAAVAISSMREESGLTVLYRRAREALFGKAWNDIDRTFKMSQGALDGSIDRWIDVLFLVSKLEDTDNAYLNQLKGFLETEGVDLSPLLHAWSTTCDVPADAERVKSRKCKVKEAMRHVNTFRNRFAHVPFPYDPIDALADGLESVTEQLFSIENTWKPGSVLGGGILQGERLTRGTMRCSHPLEAADGVNFVFPLGNSNEWSPLVIAAVPFIYIDKMARPFVLTRLKDREHGTWEYTRYRAEANAVITVDDDNKLKELPEPVEQEFPTEEEAEDVKEALVEGAAPVQLDNAACGEQTGPLAAESIADAIQAIRSGDFDPAIEFFERLTRTRPNYHVGWLRLGHAKREKAARMLAEDSEDAKSILEEAVVALTRATEHRDLEYQAQAYYERSKAHYRLMKMSEMSHTSDAAIDDAVLACQLSSDTKYQTWVEYLERVLH